MAIENETLKFAATEDLIKELVGRCKPAIFIGTKNEGGDDEGNMNFWEVNGRLECCYGLCHELAMTIQREIMKKELDAQRGEDG